MILDVLDQPLGFHIGNDLLARRFAGQASVGARHGAVEFGVFGAVGIEHLGHVPDVGVLGHDVNHRQIVALAHGIVVEVVGRRDLHATGAFLRIGVMVGNDGDTAVHQRQHHVLANQVLITLVFRMHGHGRVTEHGFRPGSGNDQVILAILGLRAVSQRVTQVPEKAFFFLVFNFQIGDGGVQFRVPVHQPLAAIDKSLVVQADKHFLNGFVEAVVHGEAFVVPVHGIAKAADLAGDGAPGVLFPVPDALDEFFPAQIVAGLVLFRSEFALNHHLGGNAGVVGTNRPQCVTALHALEAGEGVHDGVLERVAHVQAAGYVGRRDRDAVGLAFTAGAEVPFGFPVFVPLALDVFWLVGFFHGVLQ